MTSAAAAGPEDRAASRAIPPIPLPPTVRQRIRVLVAMVERTQADLARSIGVSPGHLSRVLDGARTLPPSRAHQLVDQLVAAVLEPAP